MARKCQLRKDVKAATVLLSIFAKDMFRHEDTADCVRTAIERRSPSLQGCLADAPGHAEGPR